MNNFFRICLWNANGLANHCQELQTFVCNNKIDILLISETHFTQHSYFKLPHFSLYNTNYPNNAAHGGSAVLIKNSIKHHELPKLQEDYMQATSIIVEDWTGPLALSAVYCPPPPNITSQQFNNYFDTLGPRFLSGGDFNAKHPMWGSRLASPRGRQLFKTITDKNFNYLTTGEPTYWPSDRRKLPDLLDFFVTNGISHHYLDISSNLDLSSDHSPVIVTVSSSVILKAVPPVLCTQRTNWPYFQEILNQKINLKISLKTSDELEHAVEVFNSLVQDAAWKSTPFQQRKPPQEINYPLSVKKKIAEKRRLRRVWQNSRNQQDKTNFNRAAQQLKRLLQDMKNEWFKDFTSNLTPTNASEYSLWKVTKSLKRPKTSIPPIQRANGSWAKSNIEKSETFGEFFENAFKPHFPNLGVDQNLNDYLESPQQMSLPISPFKPSEVKQIIDSDLNAKKAPGYDLITGKLLKELPRKGIVFLALIFNAVLRLQIVPSQWKVAQIVTVPKPGKPPNQVSSYRPISLLPVTSKVFEKLFLKRLMPLIQDQNLIPDHQFGFRQRHSTVEQIHRVVNVITESFEKKSFCSAVFLDISQAFDKVWIPGLLFKLKKCLPNTYYNILQSYLTNRHFQIKFQDTYTSLRTINSGVPQGSVLGPILYVLYTADLPLSLDITTATFADDTALLAVHEDPVTASRILQNYLNTFEEWSQKWRIKVNEDKSAHVTFSLNIPNCPPVSLNNKIIPQVNEVKYLGMHLDRRLTWKTHIWSKRLHLNLKFNKLSWLLASKSHLSIKNKLLVYKVILKPVWTYGIQLWGSASNSNVEILQRFQSKILRRILNAPWYVSNRTIHNDTGFPFVTEEVRKLSSKYLLKLNNHTNHLAVNLLDNSQNVYRLKRHNILDLPDRL